MYLVRHMGGTASELGLTRGSKSTVYNRLTLLSSLVPQSEGGGGGTLSFFAQSM